MGPSQSVADEVKGANNHNSKVMLGWVDAKKRFFCNAYVLLTIDEAIDTNFTLTEDKAGKSKIISKDAAHIFSTPLSSIFFTSY